MYILKNRLFLLGSIFPLFFLIGSLLTSIIPISQESPYLYDSNQNIIAKAPFPPSHHHIFGTDEEGTDMVINVLEGAKYTIGFAITISCLRLVVSCLLGILYGMYGQRWGIYFKGIISAFRYVPATILAIIFMSPILDGKDIVHQTFLQIVILALIAVPTLTEVIGESINTIAKKDFIKPSVIIGSSKIYIFRKHILPFLKPQLFIIFVQQIIQTLMILIHLGIVNIFIGGSNILGNGEGTAGPRANEWSGLLGVTYQKLMTSPWQVYAPVIAFLITILSLNLMIKGIQNTSLKNKEGSYKDRAFTVKTDTHVEAKFTFIK